MPARDPSCHHSVLCADTAPLVPVVLLKTSYAADRSPHTQLKAVWVILTCTLGMTRERPRPLMAQKKMASRRLRDTLKPSVMTPHTRQPAVITQMRFP